MVSNAHWAWWFAVDNVDDGGVKVQEDDDDVDDDNDIDDDDDGGGDDDNDNDVGNDDDDDDGDEDDLINHVLQLLVWHPLTDPSEHCPKLLFLYLSNWFNHHWKFSTTFKIFAVPS